MSTWTPEKLIDLACMLGDEWTQPEKLRQARKEASAALDEYATQLARQSEGVSDESQLERWGKAPEGSPYLLQPMADGYWTPWHIAQAAMTAVRPIHEEMLPPGLYTWLAERDLIPDLDEDGSFEWGDLITALNDHETALMESNPAQEKAEPVISPNDLNAGPEGEWYCEEHPQQLQGHDGCNGAGIPSCARLPLMLRQIRFLEQRNRELFNQYGFLADKALSHRDEDDGGWKLVPIIPTAEQKAAGDELRGEPVESIYDAMVWAAPTSVAEHAMAQKNSSVEALHQERWMLMNSFGQGVFADGRIRDRIAEIDAMLSASPEANS